MGLSVHVYEQQNGAQSLFTRLLLPTSDVFIPEASRSPCKRKISQSVWMLDETGPSLCGTNIADEEDVIY